MDTNLFFELLQVALGRREGLSRMPTAREWEEMYEEAGKQAIDGLLLTGLERLPVEQLPPLELKLQWIGETQIIEQQNRDMDWKCVELLGMLEKAGLRGSILKGQGIARLYDEELRCRRQSGDIDVYVDCGMEKALAFARSLGQEDISWDYKHLHLDLWEETEVEMHYRVEVMYNWAKNGRLQRWFEEHKAQVQGSRFKVQGVQGDEITTPTVEFNVFYILLHIYRHFFEAGVGLRQIADYFLVLKTARLKGLPLSSLIETVRTFGMDRFARGLMWVMLEVMAMPREWMPWEPDEKEGRFILSQVMEGGNFGQYSATRQQRSGRIGYMMAMLRHSAHLVRRYPGESLSAPLWIVGHWFWKMGKKGEMRIQRKR